MDKLFKECDRCGANITDDPSFTDEIEVKLLTQEDGSEEGFLKRADFCRPCYESFICWFNQRNPFTGKRFSILDKNKGI